MLHVKKFLNSKNHKLEGRWGGHEKLYLQGQYQQIIVLTYFCTLHSTLVSENQRCKYLTAL